MADRKRFAIRGGGSVVGVVGLAVLLNGLVPSGATADHMPANKVGAAGSTLEELGANDTRVVLDEVMKVPSTHDLAIQLTAECSILTALQTGELPGGPDEASDRAYAFGQVEMYVTIDGTPVPVSTTDLSPATPGVQTDAGDVVFCNRAYERRVADSEDQDGSANDGIDTQEDYIRTRAANAFNWMALDIGRYDKPNIPAGTGTNVVKIEVHARYKTEAAEQGAPIASSCEGSNSPIGQTCAEAIVGKRTLIVEPTNLSVHEDVQPASEPAPAPSSAPTAGLL